MFNVYLGDADEQEVLGWLIESIGPLAFSSKAGFNYYDTYHGSDGVWRMNTSDVSDVSGQWDEVTEVTFQRKEDAMLCSLRFGGRVV
jgi:hypothetical protein